MGKKCNAEECKTNYDSEDKKRKKKKKSNLNEKDKNIRVFSFPKNSNGKISYHIETSFSAFFCLIFSR